MANYKVEVSITNMENGEQKFFVSIPHVSEDDAETVRQEMMESLKDV